jgi:hypothetical protein
MLLLSPDHEGHQQQVSGFEEQHTQVLHQAGLRRVEFTIREVDFLVGASRVTIPSVQRHRFNVVYHAKGNGLSGNEWQTHFIELGPKRYRMLSHCVATR